MVLPIFLDQIAKTCRGSNSVWKIGITSFIWMKLLKVATKNRQKSPKSPFGEILQILKNKTCRGSNFVWKIGITSLIWMTLLKVATKNRQNRQNGHMAEFWNSQFWKKWCQIVFNDVPYNFCSEKNRKCFCKCRFPCRPPFCRTVAFLRLTQQNGVKIRFF